MNKEVQNKHLVFTGKMEHGDRNEMKEEARKLGAIVQSDVNSKTDMLICGSDVAHNSKSTKRKEAEELGIKIIDEVTYYELIKS
jgi:DNA ligase (NAD+)